METATGKSWLEISERRLRANFRALREAASAAVGDLPVLAVIKAGAYGHGADLCATALVAEGATWLGVTDADEGARVRQSLGRQSPDSQPAARLAAIPAQPRILVMCGSLPHDIPVILANQLTPVVWTPDQIDGLARAVARGATLPVHLEIDTGMSRQGVVPGPTLEVVLDRLAAAPGIHLEGVLTHFASAEIPASPLTLLQQQRFEAALAQISGRGLRPGWIHAGNTSTIDEFAALPWLHSVASRPGARPLTRTGLGLYGYALPLEGRGPGAVSTALSPVLTWKSRILALSDLAPGTTIGYNATFTAARPTRVALLPVGYADGLRRELSSTDHRPGGWIILRGQRAPILGRISMNLTTVDVTHIPGLSVGEEAILLGDGITADDHARIADTIPYEILCGLRATPRLTA